MKNPTLRVLFTFAVLLLQFCVSFSFTVDPYSSSLLSTRRNDRSSPWTEHFSKRTNSDVTAKVRFSSTSAASDANPVDTVLSWIVSATGSIVLGIIGLLLILVGRLISPESEDVTAETRVDLLAVFAVGSVLLNGLSELDVQTALAETVRLEGTNVKLPCVRGEASNELVWVMDSLVTATPASTCVLLTYIDNKWDPVAHVGVVPPNLLRDHPERPSPSPILDRFLKLELDDMSKRQESYLPTLQALPGRIEFTGIVLPENAQAALLLPLRYQGKLAVVLLGSDQARCFTPRDIAWCQAVTVRLEQQ